MQPKPLKSRTPVRENGAFDRKPASLGRWGVFILQMRTKGLLYIIIIIIIFGYINSHSARAARRLLPRAPGARSSQLNVIKARTNGRPKRTGAHLPGYVPWKPDQTRRGPPGGAGFCPSSELPPPPPSSDAPFAFFLRQKPGVF